jgi:1-acyl-sn-glycerol-3-phosphate acyltransferase
VSAAERENGRGAASPPAPRRARSVAGASGADGAWLPAPLRRLDQELEDRLARVPVRRNEYGYDPYGFHPNAARRLLFLGALAYRHYFRVETHGIENVPEGRVMLVANHSGQVGYDGSMLAMAMLLDAEPPRLCRGLGEFFFWKAPWLGIAVSRLGTVAGTPENGSALLGSDECVMVFPEGARGANKPFRLRYQLERFGDGFVRLALETHTPVVPVAIIGAEEQQPGLANWSGVGRRLGLPSLPITVSFPWLGPLGIGFALPVKYRIHFGTPLRLSGDPHDEDGPIGALAEDVRDRIAALIDEGLRQRRSVFR